MVGCWRAQERRKNIDLTAILGHSSDFIPSVCVGLLIIFLIQVGVNVKKDANGNSLI